MKKIVLLTIAVFTLCLSTVHATIVNTEGDDLLETLFVINNSDLDAALADYKSSFVKDVDGIILGAKVESLRPYLEDAQILALFTSDVLASYAIAGIDSGPLVIYERMRPKARGCKTNRRWVCQLRGTPVN